MLQRQNCLSEKKNTNTNLAWALDSVSMAPEFGHKNILNLYIAFKAMIQAYNLFFVTPNLRVFCSKAQVTEFMRKCIYEHVTCSCFELPWDPERRASPLKCHHRNNPHIGSLSYHFFSFLIHILNLPQYHVKKTTEFTLQRLQYEKNIETT